MGLGATATSGLHENENSYETSADNELQLILQLAIP